MAAHLLIQFALLSIEFGDGVLRFHMVKAQMVDFTVLFRQLLSELGHSILCLVLFGRKRRRSLRQHAHRLLSRGLALSGKL